MKTQSKKTNTIFIVILYLLAIAFFAYGIYMAVYSTNYVQSYQSNTSVATENAIQYVVTSSIAYFGFGIVILIGAIVLSTINRLQKNIDKAIASIDSNNAKKQPSIYDGEQLTLPIEDIHTDKNTNPYYVESPISVAEATEQELFINEDEAPDSDNEASNKSKKELRAEKKAAKLRKKEERAAQEATEAKRLKNEQEAAEANKLRKEQEAAETDRLRKEQQAAESDRLRKERQAAEADRLRKEQEAAEADRLRKEQEAAEADRLRREQQAAASEAFETAKTENTDDIEIETFTLDDISDANAKISSSVIKNIFEKK